MSTTTDPQDPRLRKVDESGMQEAYLVLSAEERAKGWVRPYRDRYKHVGVRPQYPVRDLTEEERAAHARYGYVKFEQYPESMAPRTGRFWTEKQLASGCGTVTTMNREIAETYAREPGYYGATYCVGCREHLPVGEHGEFEWLDGTKVGT